ncbi:hypothetical protein Patl1_30023 [Pistacia atlantica]|uniref:Uncharacterized protein n=1 Tax=Pistacia atlantica TaxID=434234 RepID=A0ACC1ABQ3_9ROSI|nr:hypothetical protein Patl1_30023 [Pistacia atlantica]
MFTNMRKLAQAALVFLANDATSYRDTVTGGTDSSTLRHKRMASTSFMIWRVHLLHFLSNHCKHLSKDYFRLIFIANSFINIIKCLPG